MKLYEINGQRYATIKEALWYQNEIENHINRPNMFNPEKRVDATIRVVEQYDIREHTS